MYSQKYEEYFGGELIGSDENGELYKGIVCFMVVGLKESIPYVISSSPEITINAAWFRNELFECLDVLYQCDFNVRAIFCDNNQSNVSTFKKLLERRNQNPDDLCMNYQCKKIYLFYDSVHLFKKVYIFVFYFPWIQRYY